MVDRYLFKAKSLENDKWEIGYFVKNQEWAYIVKPLENGQFDVITVGPNTVCQCTGLKDKNGKLIWKNDIVNFLGHKGTIVFECGSFGIAYKAPIDWRRIEANILPITGCDNVLYACANDNFISLWEIYWNFNDEDDCLSTVEVVGNIFDNAELLKNEV